MDGSKYNRNIACKQHDNAYGIRGGGSETDRIKADKEFFKHMKTNKDPLALIAYLGIRLYGWLFFNYKTNILWKGQLLKKLFPNLFNKLNISKGVSKRKIP